MSERNTHFQGAAKLLMQQVDEKNRVKAQLTGHYLDEDELHLLISQFLYDFMYFQVESRYQHRGTFRGEIHASIQMLPDMTEWTERGEQ